MSDPAAPSRPPLVLIANDQEWSIRSLESILGPSGYAVLRAYTGREAIDLARSTQPDLVVLDERMPDLRGTDVCRILVDDPRVGPHTPILLLTADSVDRELQLAALRAGAWDCIGEPLDAEAFLLRIGTWVRAKRAVDRAREDNLLDEQTGLYNVRGLARRARELGADAFRQRAPLACVAIAPDAPPAAGDSELMAELTERIAAHLAGVIRRTGRASDVVGRLGRSEFAIIAPATEAAGAVRLVERLQAELAEPPALPALPALAASAEVPPIRLRAGYCAVPDYTAASADATEMLLRAAAALRHLRDESEEIGAPRAGGSRVQAFDEIPVRTAR